MSSPERPILSNYDFPYHDFVSFDDGDEPTFYIVGTNNRTEEGDHTKTFVSKSTLFLSDVECTIRLNHRENVTITLRANVPYTSYTNISQIFILTIGTDGYLDIWMEGVLPENAGVSH